MIRAGFIKAFLTAFMLVVIIADASFAGILDDKDFGLLAMKASEDAVGRKAGDYALFDEDGKPFMFSALLGAPLVVSFVYTSCGHSCPLVVSHLSKALNSAGNDFGVKFRALTVGIDPKDDTPEKMKALGKKLSADSGKWRFAVGAPASVERLARDMGFFYRKRGDDYDHLNMVTLLSGEGTVLKQVYGSDLKAEDILPYISGGGALTALSVKGRVSAVIERIKLLCYTYDEKTGTYKPDYTFIVMMVFGAVI
ncbi:SCO family protein, partial [bacterium]